MTSKHTETAIRVENLYKTFKIPLEKSSGIKQQLINVLKRKKGYREFSPLQDISFEIKKGEFFGIVGRNGSGKSTLLKSIAGIYTLSSGDVHINGKLVPFIELGVGFNPELTGRENVYLNGAMLGFSNSEMDEMYDKIVDFAELHDFMDESLKNYSSGMQVRLAFSIAIRAQADILLLDEVLAVGDTAFQRKCFDYFAQLKRNRKTVILVTHSMDSVLQFCTRAMLLDGGKITAIGSPSKVAKAYTYLNRPAESDEDDEDEAIVTSVGVSLKKHNVQISTKSGKKTNTVTGDDETIGLNIHLTPAETIDDGFVAFTIRRTTGELMYWYTTEFTLPDLVIDSDKGVSLTATIQNIFGEGGYEVSVFVKSKDRVRDYIELDPAYRFDVVDRGMNGYMFYPEVWVDVK